MGSRTVTSDDENYKKFKSGGMKNGDRSRIWSTEHRNTSKEIMTQKISDKKLKKIFEKTKGHCAYCGNKLITWEVEHTIPRTKGGGDKIENLLPSCLQCNRKKKSKTLTEFRKWAKNVMENYIEEIEKQIHWLGQTPHKDRIEIILLCNKLKKAIRQIEIKFYIDNIMEE